MKKKQLRARLREADRACALAHLGENAYRNETVRLREVLQAIRAKAIGGYVVEKDIVAMIDAANAK